MFANLTSRRAWKPQFYRLRTALLGACFLAMPYFVLNHLGDLRSWGSSRKQETGTMPKKAQAKEQIVAVFRQVEAGARGDDVCRKVGSARRRTICENGRIRSGG